LSETVKQLTVERDQLEFELRTIRERNYEYKKQIIHMERDQLEFKLRTIREQNYEYKKPINHMEQALEKVR